MSKLKYFGIHAPVPPYRWTGEPPDPLFVARLATACRQAKYPVTDAKVGQVLYQDVTGWAFTRAAYEAALDLYDGWSQLRRSRVARLLDTLPPWPFEPTPTGWKRDGFPEDIF